MKWGRYIKSSFGDICCGLTQTAAPGDNPSQPQLTAWRQSVVACRLVNGLRDGYVQVITLEQFTVSTGVVTGVTKSNVPTDIDYIADYIDVNQCSVEQFQPHDTIVSNVNGPKTIVQFGSFNRNINPTQSYTQNYGSTPRVLTITTHVGTGYEPEPARVVIDGQVFDSTGVLTLPINYPPSTISIYRDGFTVPIFVS